MGKQFEKRSTELCRLLERFGIALFSDISFFRVKDGKILSFFGETDEKSLSLLKKAEAVYGDSGFFAVYAPLTCSHANISECLCEENLVAVGEKSFKSLEKAIFELESRVRTTEKSKKMIAELKEHFKNKTFHTLERHEALKSGSDKYYR